jgi:hypothetical protein
MSLESRIREAFERHAEDVRPSPQAWTAIERRIARAHRLRLVAAVAGAAATIIAVAVAAPQLSRRSAEPVGPGPTPTQSPEETGSPSARAPTLQAKVPVGGFAMAATEDALWVLARPEREGEAGALVRIDPASNRPIATLEVGTWPVAVAAAGNDVWVLNGERPGASLPDPRSNSLERIDARTNEVVATIPVRSGQDVATDGRDAWVLAVGSSERVALLRIDGDSNRVASELGIPGAEEARLGIGAGAIWVVHGVSSPTSPDATRLHRIDPADPTRIDDTFTVEGSGGTVPTVAVGEGSVWVTTNGVDSASGLARVDPATGRTITRITLPDAAPVGLTSVSLGGGYVWACSARGSFWKIDPALDAPAGDPVLIGDVPPVPATCGPYAFGSIWVAAGDGKIWRFAP